MIISYSLHGDERSKRFTYRVMVLQESDCPGGPPAHQPGRLARSVPQAPELAALKHRVQDALGRHVKGRGVAARVIDPVDDALPVSILHAQGMGIRNKSLARLCHSLSIDACTVFACLRMGHLLCPEGQYNT